MLYPVELQAQLSLDTYETFYSFAKVPTTDTPYFGDDSSFARILSSRVIARAEMPSFGPKQSKPRE